ncbi:TPA: peptidase domain-containing ABC transporter [Raoultella ornithinolytica]|jgi:ATP-binding cassette subfamily B protein RaxB|uniref:peptidase domain-containing ABC transporter n=1 Tax=Raoultella ornithinolytica TaxID=54291 RepID=UPI001A21837B|nr:peptidase domain-containing ABC transporter [Raoultella ornithinolytica]EKU8631584.1 peptidase domain-containing ABC transporter [Raoultella ornithinolytica]HAT2375429.1 peptidase domain-containing ABC transporter [Raoultella ornithinolytica]HAV2047798.1 peptidase domain-containing ABC transporter [Raoultella ornithinolytica]HAV2053715.1 peptidase domain-containing ABC transporter [Raoultella ornithinolytica]HAV2259959.1 peptidase domain-containing ABC transporter [Raoultella ornithinolytic
MNKDVLDSIFKRINFSMKNKVPVIIQSESTECGNACLSMICGFYGKDIDLFNFRNRYGSTSQGATLNVLAAIAQKAGLKTRALSLDIAEIKELRLPCILHWSLNHFVVLVAIKGKRFIIHDPALGRRVVHLQELSENFSGIALEAWPDSDFRQEKQRSRLKLLDLMHNMVGLKSALIKIFMLSVVIETVNLLLPMGTQIVTDHVITAHDENLLLVICVGLMFFTIFKTWVSMIRAWVSLKLNTLTDVQWKTSFFDHLMSLPLAFFEKRQLGDIQSRFASLDIIRATFTNSIVTGMIDSIMTIGLLIMLSLYGGWLVWVVLGFTICYAIMRALTYKFYRTVSEELIVKRARSGSHFMESLYGIATIKSLNLKNRRSQHWLNTNIDVSNAGLKQTRFDMLFGGINTFINSADQVVILWLGAQMVMDNTMTIGMFMAFNAYRGQFTQRAASLIDLTMQLKMLSLHNERISEIVYSEPEVDSPLRNVFEENVGVSLEVRDLAYQYDLLSKPVFSNVNISVAAGESVALVGVSGIGKTTLLKVMSGLLTPERGEIFIGGFDINKIGINNFRSNIACVLQEDRLFSGSITDNISGFDDEVDEALVIECAMQCNIHEEILRMPMGYETIIGELGAGISGGQKQRLLIARALYQKPRILFMDEATSHLDINNEKIINAAIESLNITRIIIAHRPSTIACADRIIDLAKITP